MVLNVHRNHKAYKGRGEWVGGWVGSMAWRLHSHHQNDFCIKVGSDESHFNVSKLRGGLKTVFTDHNVCRERKAEAVSNRGPSAYQPNALPLGQTG